MEWYGRSQAESIKMDRPRRGWGSDTERPRAWLRRDWYSRCRGQATDMAVAQPVEDEREKFAGGGDLADVRAASFADPHAGLPERTLAKALDGLDRGPPNQRVALLGDPPPVDLGVGLTVLGGHAGPGAQLLRAGEPVHIADLGDKDRRQHRADTADGLYCLEAGVGLQLAAG